LRTCPRENKRQPTSYRYRKSSAGSAAPAQLSPDPLHRPITRHARSRIGQVAVNLGPQRNAARVGLLEVLVTVKQRATSSRGKATGRHSKHCDGQSTETAEFRHCCVTDYRNKRRRDRIHPRFCPGYSQLCSGQNPDMVSSWLVAATDGVEVLWGRLGDRERRGCSPEKVPERNAGFGADVHQVDEGVTAVDVGVSIGSAADRARGSKGEDVALGAISVPRNLRGCLETPTA
jgi:hypothetical protein